MQPKVTAVIVARAGSVRIPNKALQPFAGRTLVGHAVWRLNQCASVDEVVVGSDSEAILDEGRKHGATGIRRDEYFCDERICPANDMLADMAARITGDVILWAHPTNPLISPQTYNMAVLDYLHAAQGGIHDSLVSVYSVYRHAWVDGWPTNYDPWAPKHTFAKDVHPIMFQDGGIFIQPREQMLNNRYFFGKRPLLFEMPRKEVCDIDTIEDLERARIAWEVLK